MNHNHPTAHQGAIDEPAHTIQDVHDTRTALIAIHQGLIDVGSHAYELSELMPCYELSRLPTVLCLLTDEVNRLLHALDTAYSTGEAVQLLSKLFWIPTHHIRNTLNQSGT